MSELDKYIRKNVQSLQTYVPGEQTKNPTVIKLNTNENPYLPSSEVFTSLSNFNYADLHKYPDPVSSVLVKTVSTLHDLEIGQVIMGNGSDELLALCTRCFVPDGGCIAYFEPSYSLYPVLSDVAGVKKKEIPLKEDFTWPDSLEVEADLFFITQPNAPSGNLHSLENIRAFCERFDGVIVIDEAYVDFASFNCVELLDDFKNVLILRTLSKSYALAGIRLGYALGHADLIHALYKIKDSYNINMLTQEIGAAALLDQSHKNEICKKIIHTRGRVLTKLTELGFKVFPSEANFLWVEAVDSDAFEIFTQLKEAGIYIRYFSTPELSKYLRITIGTDDEMKALLTKLRQIV